MNEAILSRCEELMQRVLPLFITPLEGCQVHVGKRYMSFMPSAA